MNKKIRPLTYLLLMLLVTSCSSTRVDTVGVSDSSNNYFSGLYVVEASSGEVIINSNSSHYFTPASTVKLFTLYTALKYLPDSIASISYFDTEDRMYIKPMADPSFLYDSLPNTTFDFLKNTTKEIVLIPEEFSDFIYGLGWQWDDYHYYYMPEKSLFPIYGNLATLDGNAIQPKYFQSQVEPNNASNFNRDFFQNVFFQDSIKSKINKKKIPFRTSLELSRQLLSDTLQKPVYFTKELKESLFIPYISTPTYPLYQRLMNESENFIAEQLFLVIAKGKTGEYKVKNTIDFVLDSLLSDIPDKPRWVDASGLSRYNLFTPKSMVYLLRKMYDEYGEKEVFKLVPNNGNGGSLQKWYPSEKTYIYAKTGSLSNNHSICGFLITKKGKLLVFSYMNNNYMQNSSDIRATMNKKLQEIYTTF